MPYTWEMLDVDAEEDPKDDFENNGDSRGQD